MEIFTKELREQMLDSFIAALASLLELLGAFVKELLNLIVLPIHEFSFTNLVISLGGIAIVATLTRPLLRFLGSFFSW